MKMCSLKISPHFIFKRNKSGKHIFRISLYLKFEANRYIPCENPLTKNKGVTLHFPPHLLIQITLNNNQGGASSE